MSLGSDYICGEAPPAHLWLDSGPPSDCASDTTTAGTSASVAMARGARAQWRGAASRFPAAAEGQSAGHEEAVLPFEMIGKTGPQLDQRDLFSRTRTIRDAG
eukprot:scaffold642_cov232-Pinguiococcus_pyrenoidosus.AAC.18